MEFVAQNQSNEVDFDLFKSEVLPVLEDAVDQDNWIDHEIEALEAKIHEAEIEKEAIGRRRCLLCSETCELRKFEDNLMHEYNRLLSRKMELEDEVSSLEDANGQIKEFLEKLMQINVMNDAFHIWYTGPYGTINNFRLGNLPVKPIDHNEINAALGQAALAVSILSDKAGVRFKNYTIIPMGNNSKISKVDDKRSVYPLFLDPTSFSFFPKRNFNFALSGFMCCVQELGEYVANYDPTMSMPYKIDLSESKINDISFVYGVDDEIWTRSLKFMLSNIKWIVAWYTKHGSNAPLN